MFLFLKIALMHLRSRNALASLIEKAICPANFRFHPEFSGRSALCTILTAIPKKSPSEILVPDYICNVVHKACQYAGYETVSYPSDNDDEAWHTIREAIRERSIKIVIVASIFGSGACLKQLRKPETREFLCSNEVFVIADLCQDISLLTHLPEGYGKYLSAVVSFNDKSFPGAMGGGLVCNGWTFPIGPSLTLHELGQLYRWFVHKERAERRRHGKPGISAKNYEFSYCLSFPSRLERHRPARLQLVLGVIGVRSLADFMCRKKAVLAAATAEGADAPFLDSAPYIVVPSGKTFGRRRKRPYALPCDSNRSLRPADVVIHNKGFHDF